MNKKSMDKKYIITTTLIACIALYFVEQFMSVNYAVKTVAKILLFGLIPYFYIIMKKSSIKKALNFENIDKKHLKYGFLLGIFCFLTIIVTYCILKNVIDFESISYEMQNKSKITPGNFILVGAYVTFGNSFLEEFFFRGFVFLNLYECGYKKIAYIFSALAFGLYHIGIFKNWFNLPLTLLALVGLISVGFIFNLLNTKSKNFLNSWLVHIFADSAIILIGFKMFEII